MESIKVGTILYHKTQKTKCEVIETTDENIKVKLDNLIANQDTLSLRWCVLGEFLFFEKCHIDMEIEDLIFIIDYWNCKRFVEYFNNISPLESKRIKDNVIKIRQEKQLIQKVIKNRKINNLIHFTQLDNLKSILSDGIKPVDILHKENNYNFTNINFLYNDSGRWDRMSDCTCFSVEFPNTRLLNNYRAKKYNSKWVMLVIDSKILTELYYEVHFCKHNAATKSVCNELTKGNLISSKCFEEMFGNIVSYQKADGTEHIIERSNSLKNIPWLPTSDQSEILIKGLINTSYIKEVCFETYNDLRSYASNIEHESLLRKYNYSVNSAYFSNRDSFIKYEIQDTIYRQQTLF